MHFIWLSPCCFCYRIRIANLGWLTTHSMTSVCVFALVLSSVSWELVANEITWSWFGLVIHARPLSEMTGLHPRLCTDRDLSRTVYRHTITYNQWNSSLKLGRNVGQISIPSHNPLYCGCTSPCFLFTLEPMQCLAVSSSLAIFTSFRPLYLLGHLCNLLRF